MNLSLLKELTQSKECGHLEFKREWYWNTNEKPSEKADIQKKWGEFIKDILAITNGNTSSFQQTRFLIFGFDENTLSFHDCGINPTSYQKLLTQIKGKIESHITPQIQKINYYFLNENNSYYFIVKIEQHDQLFSLKKLIQTKSISYAKDTILCRKLNNDNKDDSIGIMSQEELLKYRFLIESTYKKIDSISTYKVKSIHETVLSYIRRSNNLEIEDNYPKKSNSIKNYYEIYKLRNKIHGTFEYFIFINEDSSQQATLKEIKSIETFEMEPFLLTNKPLNLKDPEIRISNLKKSSGWNKVNFIDDFGTNFLYNKPLQPFIFEPFTSQNAHFIKSLAKSANWKEEEAFKFLNDWYQKDDQPLIAVTGEGGIGKTTLVKEFLNQTLTSYNNYVLYLDSETVISNITAGKISDIYDLYKTVTDESEEQFDKQLFKLCIDNGTLLVVIDGLDEVVARLSSKFNLNEFITSIITNYSFNLTRAKIIITCRDSIWENYSNNDSEKITEIKLLPFTEQQTKEYFEKSFKTNKLLAIKSISLVNGLKLTVNENHYYSPFILDTVRRLVKENTDTSDIFSIKAELSDKYHLNNSPTDFLIIKVLQREEKKNPYLTIDKQIDIFTEISNTDESGIYKDFLFSKIKKNIDHEFEKKDFESLLSHQFLTEIDKKIFFRYDFFKEFFSILQKSILINSKDINFIKCLNSSNFANLGYLNSYTKQIAKKIKLEKEDLDLYFADLLDIDFIKIKLEDFNLNLDILDLEHKSSLIFCLYATIISEMNKLNNTIDMNEIIENFYIRDGNIKNLYLINMNINGIKPKLVFDFKSKKINSSKIKFFSNFIDCTFDEKTFFSDDCSIYISEGEEKFRNINLSFKNFDEKCDINDNLYNLLSNISKTHTDKISDNEKELNNFLKIFKKNGDFKPQKEEFIRSRKGHLVKKMLTLEVIIQNPNAKINYNEFIINPNYHEELFNYIDQNSPCKFADDIIKLM
ncbi:NACHT domain-containing protein [Acinetobacter baumannii]|uniref:NACHT domain-containing protein n=1 Tax=Acinetobacter baumannii TaxID=470 RepID=UPI000925D539|nr:NACHT domain-containing protein [Acinetobacter baumannii]MDH2625014.1 NACHT domain-containing protein [Acinetobacter baumannii]OJK06576.1 hypothetical protein BRY75_12405 [Acinetobacter baumannii]